MFVLGIIAALIPLLGNDERTGFPDRIGVCDPVKLDEGHESDRGSIIFQYGILGVIEPPIGLLMRENIGYGLRHERPINHRVLPRMNGAGVDNEGRYSHIGNILYP